MQNPFERNGDKVDFFDEEHWDLASCSRDFSRLSGVPLTRTHFELKYGVPTDKSRIQFWQLPTAIGRSEVEQLVINNLNALFAQWKVHARYGTNHSRHEIGLLKGRVKKLTALAVTSAVVAIISLFGFFYILLR